MVDSSPRLVEKRYWIPTKAAGERLFWMSLKFSLNRPSRKGQPSLAEVVLSSGSVDEALLALPSIIPAKIRAGAEIRIVRANAPTVGGREGSTFRLVHAFKGKGGR
jgi:hypothetical protein